MKKTKILTANIIASLILIILLLLNVSAQNSAALQQTETTNSTRERKAGNVSSMPANAPRENYPTQQPNLPPAVDYLKEAERFQRETESNRRKQNSDPRQQIDEIRRDSEAESERLQELNNQVIQQQDDRLNGMAEQQRESALEAKKQEENAKKIAAEQWKWIWLIPLFEFLQAVGLGFIVYKFNVAKKSVTAMIVGLVVCLLLYLAVVLQLKIDLFPIGLILGIVSIYAYAVGKLSTYVVVSLLPEKLVGKLLSVLIIGSSLIALYSIISAKTGYGSIGALFGFLVIVIGGVTAIVRNTKSGKEDLHGSARFATKKELKEFEKEIESGAFVLAPIDPEGHHGKVSLPRSLSVMHGLILGGSGTGKSRGYFMPNCAEVKDTSIVVTDPKSELWKYTSGFHQKALRFAPTEPDASQCFNWIPLCTDARMSELCARAIMTAGSTQNTDQFWIDAETAFLSAIFAHTATTKYPTPLTAYRLFTRKKPEELLQMLLNSPSYVAREQAVVFEQTDARIKGAIVPAVASRMQFMRDHSIQLFTSAQLEAPNFGQLRHAATAVYWCLREQDIVRLRPLTSLFFTILLEQIAGAEVPENAGEIPINLFLDEFANIGKIPDFETIISLARGRGVALWLGIQSLSQLNQTYGNHAAQTIISNCATKVALHGLDYQTAEYVSKMLGEKTVSHRRSSFGFGTGGFTFGSGGAEHRRQLLTPDEVMRLDEDEAIARTSNKYPMILFKGYYNAEPNTFPLTQSLTKIYADDEKSEPEEILI